MKELDEQGYQTAQECLEFGQNFVQQQHIAQSKSHNNMDNESLEPMDLAPKKQVLYIKNMVDISHETNTSMVLSVNENEDYIQNAQNLVQPDNII